MESTKRMVIQYPDNSIHDVDCYKFAKARLETGEIVYYIEYKDYKNRDAEDFVDSYSVIELDNQGWHKTDKHIDYSILASHTIEELSINNLRVSTLGFKTSVNHNYDRNVSHTSQQIEEERKLDDNQVSGPTFVRKPEEPQTIPQTQTETQRQKIDPQYFETEQKHKDNKIIYVPLFVDFTTQQYIHPHSMLVRTGWIFDKTEVDDLEFPNEMGGLAIEGYYDPKTITENFKQDINTCQSIKYDKVDPIPTAIGVYLQKLYLAEKEKGEKYVRFDALEPQVIDGITYSFIKNPGNININHFTSLNIYLKKGEENLSRVKTLEKFLNFELPIGYGLISHDKRKIFTGLTKDNLIKYLRKEIQRKNYIIDELQKKDVVLKDESFIK